MARRFRQHVNPHDLHMLVPRGPLDIPKVDHLIIDLGCGDGAFTIACAENHPQSYFIGLDIRQSFIEPGIKRIEELGLKNIHLDVCNLIVDADHLFQDGSIDRIFVNFPDPFFKRSQHARRWLTSETLAYLVKALKKGGDFIFQSDVWDPSLEALTLLSLNRDLENVSGEFSFHKGRIVEEKTSREISVEERELPIWRMRFIKRLAQR